MHGFLPIGNGIQLVQKRRVRLSISTKVVIGYHNSSSNAMFDTMPEKEMNIPYIAYNVVEHSWLCWFNGFTKYML